MAIYNILFLKEINFNILTISVEYIYRFIMYSPNFL